MKEGGREGGELRIENGELISIPKINVPFIFGVKESEPTPPTIGEKM